MAKYALGLDYRTESARALLVDVADGREAGTAVAAGQSVADPGRSAGRLRCRRPADRGGRLARLAAYRSGVPQRLPGGIQGDVVGGGGLSLAGIPASARSTARTPGGRQAVRGDP